MEGKMPLFAYRRPVIWMLLLLVLVLMESCQTHQKIVYFRANPDGTDSLALSSDFTFHYKTNDIVSIVVSGADPDLVKPFNSVQLGMTSNQDGYQTGTSARDGYLIDENGEINFPVIGKVKLSGLTRSEAIELMTQKVKEYVNDVVVNIRVTNFKITVLGSVSHPGTFNIPNERITLLEALGIAQDMKITGVRKNVLVIREQNGTKQEYRVDLTTRQLYKSPVYYLQQNDVVYVEPNRAERNGSTVLKSSAGIILSGTTLLLTFINIMLN